MPWISNADPCWAVKTDRSTAAEGELETEVPARGLDPLERD